MRQVRTIRYREIADDLREQLDGDAGTAGRMLASESELAARYNASRVTIRKALELLRGEGRVDARQGYGWFAVGEPVRQPLGHLATIESQLEAEGRHSERRIVDFAFVSAPDAVRDVLGVDKVLKLRRVNLADGVPFARVTVWCPEHLGTEVSRSQVRERSFYDLLPITLGGATQTIGAAAADGDDAELLGVPVGSPVLKCERITSDIDARPVLIGEYVFPAHRSTFTVDLPHPEASIAPSGLRLLE